MSVFHYHVPIFVAKDLDKLPAVGFDHIDVSRLLKDITRIHSEIKVIKDTYATTEQLLVFKKECQHLNMQPSFNNSYSNINRKRGGGGIANSFCLDSGPMGLPPFEKNSSIDCSGRAVYNNKTPVAASTQRTSLLESPVSPVKPVLIQTASGAGASVIAPSASTAEPPPPPLKQSTELLNTPRRVGPKQKTAADRTIAEIVNTDSEWKKEMQSDEWLLVQKRRFRNQLVGSKGKAVINSSMKFKAADIKIPLFINNVDKNTNEKDIIEYIEQKTRVTVTIKKIDMRKQKRYDAYKIFVPHTKLSLFLDDDLWPEGIQFRKFIYFNRDAYTKNKVLNDGNITKLNDGCIHNKE